MAGVTALLRSAAATRKKIQAQEDAEVAFQWENSAQTYEDYLAYSKYLEDRLKTAPDASAQLSYATKLRSARRSYTSNEIQREQIDIMEGRAGTQDKMNAVRELYYEAVENGDFNLAQNLYSQYDALSIKLQNEQETAAKAFASASTKVKDDFVKSLKQGYDDVTLPDGRKVTPLAALEDAFRETGDTVAVLKAAEETMEALRDAIVQQYESATTQEEVDKLERDFGPGLRNLDRELKVDLNGTKLNAQEVVNGIANDELNNPVYGLKAVRNEATGKNEFQLQKNNVERIDYARQFDEEGNEYYAPITVRTDQNRLFFGQSDQGKGIDTQITDTGEVIGAKFDQNGKPVGNVRGGQAQAERNDAQTIGNRLKQLGIDYKQNGTTLSITLPGENVEREATIESGGAIRFFGDDGQMQEIVLTRKNLGTDMLPQVYGPNTENGWLRTVSAEEVSDFARASNFGGLLSRSSAQGDRYTGDIMGRSVANTALTGRESIATGNDFSGFGAPATTNLLQSASQTRQQVLAEAERRRMQQAQADMAARLEASRTFNLNQVPVQQLTSTGILKSQLQVAAPTPQARVYVAPPVVAPRVSSVAVAPAQPRVYVQSRYAAPTSNTLSF